VLAVTSSARGADKVTVAEEIRGRVDDQDHPNAADAHRLGPVGAKHFAAIPLV